MIEAAELEAGPWTSASVSQALTAGALLREAREAAGLHVAAMAVALKVSPAKLEALEQDKYELFPDAVFVRGLASAICRNLKIDPAPVLQLLPQTHAPRLVQDSDGLNAPFRSPRDQGAPQWREQLTRPVSLAVLALLVGVVVLIALPVRQQEDGAVTTAEVGEKAPAAAGATLAPRPTELTVAPTPALVAAVPPAPGAIVPASISAPAAPRAVPVTEPPAPAAAATAAPAALAASAAPANAAAASGVVVFRTKRESWVEVVDAKGVVAIRKLMAPGEAAGASGAMPLQVTIGKVDATEVQVRGKPFNLRPFARDNVARFEVK
jgi:cytoskeleton protein RodZ